MICFLFFAYCTKFHSDISGIPCEGDGKAGCGRTYGAAGGGAPITEAADIPLYPKPGTLVLVYAFLKRARRLLNQT